MTDVEKFLGIFACSECGNWYCTSNTLYAHKKSLHAENHVIELKARKGRYKCQRTLQDLLQEAGVPEKYLKNVQYPYFAVFDIESSLKDTQADVLDGLEVDSSLIISSEHIPMAIGITTNFSTKTKLFVVKKNSVGIVSVIDKFILYALKLSKKAERLYRKKQKIAEVFETKI